MTFCAPEISHFVANRTGSKPAGIEQHRPVALHRGNLVQAAVVNPGVGDPERRARHLAGIAELIGEIDVRDAEGGLGRQRVAEHLRQADGARVRPVRRRDFARIWNLVAISPPQTHGEVLLFGLQVVACE